MEQTEVELNEKLARWAGFKPDGLSEWWINPDGYTRKGIPTFTRDWKACTRWLVPHANGAGDLALALCRAIDKMIDSEHPA